TSDGSGGAIITWNDLRGDGVISNIYAQRINANGTFTAGDATISFNGWVKISPNWPSTDGVLPLASATVNALNESGTPFASAPTGTDGSFSIAGIPASSTFRLVIPTPASTTYVPVLGKFMNWNADIQALLPFVLFTQEQYAAFDNVTGSGMILGRVALKSSPTTFLSGATIEALEWTPGNPPVLGAAYPVTYTSGSATQADGIYMVKNVTAGKLVQLVATLENHTFEFNSAVIPVQTGFLSEESFFGTPGSTAQVTIFSNEAAFNAAASSSTLVDFEDRDTSTGRVTFAGNEYAASGVTFSTPNSQPLWVYPPPTSNWTWPSEYLSPGNAPFEGGDSNEDSLTLTFSPAVAAIGWTFLDMPNPNVVTIRVYDQSNTLIHEALNGAGIVLGADSNSAFWGILSPTPIARVEIIDEANNGDDVAYDNFRFSATITPATISFSGMLKKFSDDTPVGGASVEMVGNASIKTTTAADGTFTLPGLPSGTGFMVKFTGDTGVYVPTYTGFMLSTVDMTSPRSFNLFTPNELSYWGVTSGNGVIRGRVMNGANQTAGYVSGATVSYASFLGITYTVKYENNEGILTTGTGTSANGKYYILNVAEGDTVTVSAAHPYYSFPQPRQFATHGAAAHQGLVNGVAVSGRVAIGGHIMNTADPAAGIKSATIEQFGAASPINATTSNLDGAFYLSVPATTTLQLKFSKPKDTTLAPTYSANMSFGADNLAVGDYNLFLKTILSNSVASGGWGVTPGKGIIRARVKDQAGNYLGGATVTAQGVSKSYAVCYDNACTLEATPDTGRYIVKDVDDGDTVTVTAQKQGWTFNTRFLPTHADSVHQGSVTGTPAAATTHPEAAAIQTRFEAAMAAFNANDFTGFASYVSAGYLDRGLNKDQFVAEAQQERTAHGVKSWTIQSITGAENNAVMNILWNDGYIDTMYFRKEGDVWLLYGNQKLFDVWANSGHEMYSTNPYLYWVSLQVKDPDSS
ncbi:MAG: carboxypeptidase-like regulatory domain-containing protein, partial [Proteobacteria bacterium]|nr:carboxypeptidase-like regulatory domain-containing protein [Pseudomonadota bacterium]